MLVFGWNNFRIKSYYPSELGLSNNHNADFTIEARQSYFHLFWIPFFGLGKTWNIRKGGQLYELPAHYQQHIETINLRVKTPWYTFAGPLLIIAGFLFINASESWARQEEMKRATEEHIQAMQIVREQIPNVSENDYYFFRETKQGWYSDKNVYAKVDKITDKAVKFLILELELPRYEAKPNNLGQHFMNDIDKAQEIWINKTDLVAAVSDDYEGISKMTANGSPILNNGKNYFLMDIIYVDGPAITDRRTGGSRGNGTFYMEFLNYGEETTLIAIENLENTIEWTTKLPFKIEESHNDYEPFQLNGKGYKGGKYKFNLVCQNGQGKKHRFVVEGVEMTKTVKRVRE